MADVELALWIEQIRERAFPRERRRRERGNEFLCSLGEDATHRSGAFFWSADEIERFVGGNPAADDQQNAARVRGDGGLCRSRARIRRRALAVASAERRTGLGRVPELRPLIETSRVAQNGASFVLHRAAVARRAQPQPALQALVELADGDAGHGAGCSPWFYLMIAMQSMISH